MPNLTPRGKLRVACDLLIWGGEDGLPLPWDEAAKKAGLTTRTLRLAMMKPHCRQYLRRQQAAMLAYRLRTFTGRPKFAIKVETQRPLLQRSDFWRTRAFQTAPLGRCGCLGSPFRSSRRLSHARRDG